jgi:hypothetical protein
MLGMMSATGRRATNQKETHHDPTIQEVITFSVRVQVSYCVLPEISISDIQGSNRRDGQAISISTVQTEGTNRSAGTECAARPCVSGSVNTTKYSVSEFMGYLKGKMALRLFQQYESLGRRYWGRHLWARGYCVSTIGLDEEKIRKYVQWQEKQEKQVEAVQGKLFD